MKGQNRVVEAFVTLFSVEAKRYLFDYSAPRFNVDLF